MTTNPRSFCAAIATCACVLGLLASCGRGESAAESSPRAPAPEPATGGGEQAGTPEAAQPAPDPVPDLGPEDTAGWEPVPPRIEDFMEEHFVIATWSRDAVINGSLEALRDPLRALADYDYRSVTPGGWMPRVAQMQAAARLTAQAESLDAAAAGVAAMARQCGDCHAEQRKGPYFGPEISAPKSPPPDSFGERMHRHMWAADRMWEGLTGPSNEAWNAGASALANAPAGSPASEPPLPPVVVERLLELRELGTDALAATTSEERANVYGVLLASCASCHSYDFEPTF